MLVRVGPGEGEGEHDDGAEHGLGESGEVRGAVARVDPAEDRGQHALLGEGQRVAVDGVKVCERITDDALRLAPWDRALEEWARSYRAAFAAHPRAIPLLMTTPVRAPRVLAQYERAVELLLAAGFAVERVMPLLTGLENLVLGSALDLAAPEAMWEPTARTPLPARALGAVGEGRADAAFELALAAQLAYARTLLAADADAGGGPGTEAGPGTGGGSRRGG
ncbi:hypothetical protein CP968_23550 [Streptomyces subrutilus]|uniref:Tetracycline repressor TetR C-terminal domain-containing protein n=1 Tax=Streptomyces subrutilus TaxID=36818 RepID=A0A5P2UXP1_9ACTN|nr:hypothetical protein CP968_23550 [Streptomyces subrutilus]